LATGVKLVIVNGRVAFGDGDANAKCSGTIVRKI